MFDPNASEPPAVQCSVVEEHTNGMVHVHGVIVTTRDITGQFTLRVMIVFRHLDARTGARPAA